MAPLIDRDIDGFFFGDGHKGFKWQTIGQVIGGLIIDDPYKAQETEFKDENDKSPRRPAWWDDKASGVVYDTDGQGRRPVWQLVVPCQGNVIDPTIVNDDGIRAIYIAGRRMKTAVRDELMRHGVKNPAKGGTLLVRWSGGQATKASPREFQAKYTPPANNLSDVWDAPATSAPPVAPQPVAAPVGPVGSQYIPPVAQPAQDGWNAPAPQPVAAQPPTQDGWNAPAPQPVAPSPVAQTIPQAAWDLMSPAQQAGIPMAMRPVSTGQPVASAGPGW